MLRLALVLLLAIATPAGAQITRQSPPSQHAVTPAEMERRLEEQVVATRRIAPRAARVALVDFAWPELGVFMEFDGRVKYEDLLRPGERASDVVLRERDRERLICETTGWVCVRVSWADLARPARLAARIRAAMNRRSRLAS